MFGSLKPMFKHVSYESQQLYHAAYCNLCAALSASGAGVWNRLFLVNDVVTLDWLFLENSQSPDHVFSCHNCVKGGAIGQAHKITAHQKLLAAISTFTCGVKIRDNAADDPKLTNRSLALLYRPLMKKAESILGELNILDRINAFISLDHNNEIQQNSNLSEAAAPTEEGYALMASEISQMHSTLPKSLIELLGRYLGRCVYFMDAIKDMDEDKKKNQYNVLNLNQNVSQSKHEVIESCLLFLKPMRLEITEKLEIHNDLFSSNLSKKWESLLISIENQFLKLIKPLNDNRLFAIISSFSISHIHCLKSPIKMDEISCVPNLCGCIASCVQCCCPCCKVCPCCKCCSCCSEEE
jgi:hypothetical protein